MWQEKDLQLSKILYINTSTPRRVQGEKQFFHEHIWNVRAGDAEEGASFPPVAAKLLALLSNPSVQFKQIADLIGTDATFTARILQRVNSIELGRTASVSNFQQAVGLRGIVQITTYAIISVRPSC